MPVQSSQPAIRLNTARHWQGLDFTYDATWTGFVDWPSSSTNARLIMLKACLQLVGRRMSRTAHTGGVLDALNQARHDRRPNKSYGLANTSIAVCSTSQSNSPPALPTQGLYSRSAVSVTATTTPSPRPLLGFIEQQSSASVVRGNRLHRRSCSIGSTAAARSNSFAVFRLARRQPNTTLVWRS